MFATTLSDSDRQELLREAYRLQAGRKAFRLRAVAPEETAEE